MNAREDRELEAEADAYQADADAVRGRTNTWQQPKCRTAAKGNEMDGMTITVKGRIAVAMMPDLHNEQLETVTNRVYEEIQPELSELAQLRADLAEAVAACKAIVSMPENANRADTRIVNARAIVAKHEGREA